ncbi:sulfatase-like hydrolase/transferase [Vibrio vulnificus]|uniref:sulfatase-like hydrolase/transferase n=1 Tax=Vibrio vulnificus TaxID=672 RepID=UPI003EDA72BA
MNFALLLMDQTRADMLGCYGHPVVQTPNMDSIAAAGARFEQAFCTSSVCTPSRTSLFTGKMPSHHGVMCNSDKEGDKCDVPLEDANLISELPNHQHIYIGKWHIGHQKLPQEYGFVGHNFDGYAYPGSGVYQNLAFDSVPLNGNRYQEWLQEKGFAPPKVSDCTFGNNPNLKIQEFYGLLHAPVEASIPYFLVDEAISHIEKCLQQNGHFTPYPQRMWRTKEYKLVFNASGRSELYHLRHDPQEMHNLIDDPNYGEIKQSMIEAMYAEMQRYHDPLCTWFYRMKAVI